MSGLITRPVALICTGHGTHPVRELVVLVPVRPRADIAAVLGVEPEPVPERGFALESSSVTENPRGRRRRLKSDARLVNSPHVGWQVVAPGCPTCGGALAQPVAAVAAHVAAHFPHDTSRVDVDIRPPVG